jgi:hypothetical protein
MNIRMSFMLMSLVMVSMATSGCVGHTHTERIVERDVPSSNTTVVTP